MHDEYGTKEYFVAMFKKIVMDNLVKDDPIFLTEAYADFEKEILECLPKHRQIDYLKNLNKAYDKVKEELFGPNE